MAATVMWTTLSLLVAAGVAYATVVLVRLPKLPRAARWIAAGVGAYGTIAFLDGVFTGTPLPSLLAGHSFWRMLPYVLQGAVLGGFVVLPLALVVSVVRAGLRVAVPGSRVRAIREAAVLAVSLAIVVAVLPRGGAPVVSVLQTAATGQASRGVGGSPERLAALENSFRAIEDGQRDSPRDRWDPDYVVQQLGRDPRVLFEWVRDHTYWIPYRGSLRGPVGVLMDRSGNSLDRALLLGALLEKAGHAIQLANGEMDREAAAARLPLLMAARTSGSFEPAAVPLPSDQQFQAVAAQYQLDDEGLRQTLESQSGAVRTLFESLGRRVGDQTKRLLSAIGGTRAGDRTQRLAAAIDALRDHWWVQWNDGGRWVDLDLVVPSGFPGEAAAAVQRTVGLSAATDGQHHEIAVRLVIEQWTAGTLIERPVLQHILRPADLHGAPVALTIWPTGWPANFSPGGGDRNQALRRAAAEQQQWMATLSVGGRVEAASLFNVQGEVENPQRGGPMAGLGAAIGRAFGSEGPSAGPGKELTAAWFEYEIRSPGEPPRTIRRDLFDLLDPSMRAAKPVPSVPLDDARRASRALSLMMRTEILPLACRIPSEFVLHLVSRAMLANRDLIRSLARGELTPDTVSIEQVAERSARMPSALYALAVLRLHNGQSSGGTYIERPGILTRHTFFASSPQGLQLRDATDIVANEVGVDPTRRDAFIVRLQQGVLDTNAEALLQSSGRIVASTAEAFAASTDWVSLKTPDDPDIDNLGIPERARWRIRQDLGAGFVVVAPTAPVTLASQPYVGWWRIDPRTGDALGVSADGWGTSAVERAAWLRVLAAAELGFLFEYIWCGGGGGKGPSDHISRALPQRPARWTVALMDFLVVPLEAVSDCFFEAVFAALVAGGMELWVLRYTLIPRLFPGEVPAAPPSSPGIPGSQPSSPEAPPSPPSPPKPPTPPSSPPETPTPPQPPGNPPNPHPGNPGAPRPEECLPGGGKAPEFDPFGKTDPALGGPPTKMSPEGEPPLPEPPPRNPNDIKAPKNPNPGRNPELQTARYENLKRRHEEAFKEYLKADKEARAADAEWWNAREQARRGGKPDPPMPDAVKRTTTNVENAARTEDDLKRAMNAAKEAMDTAIRNAAKEAEAAGRAGYRQGDTLPSGEPPKSEQGPGIPAAPVCGPDPGSAKTIPGHRTIVGINGVQNTLAGPGKQ